MQFASKVASLLQKDIEKSQLMVGQEEEEGVNIDANKILEDLKGNPNSTNMLKFPF